MAEYCHRAYFWLRPTQYTPLALGLTDLGSSTERWMRALVAERLAFKAFKAGPTQCSFGVKRSCLRIPFGFGASKSVHWVGKSLFTKSTRRKENLQRLPSRRGGSVLKNAKAPARSVRVLERIPFRFEHNLHGERSSCTLLPRNRQRSVRSGAIDAEWCARRPCAGQPSLC
jgi:hypothetical protein